ncbi:MAG TPA: ABC transporter substrate-binding protein [Gemmatirosa sp.]
MPALRVPGHPPCRAPHRARAIRHALNAAILANCAQLGTGCARAAAAPGAWPREVAIGIALDADRPGMTAVQRGAELAAVTLAAEPATLARGLRFVVRGTPHGLNGAVATAERLRDDPAVIGIVGDPESGRTLDAVSVFEDVEHGGTRAVAAVTPTGTSAALAGRSPWLFRLSPDDETASRAVAAYVADSLHARRIAIVYRNDAYGRDWATAFARAYTRAFEHGGNALVARDPYLAGVTDWPVYARYLTARHPDVILFPGDANEAAALLRALRAAGDHTPLLGGDGVAPLADSAEFAGARYAVPFTAAAAERADAPAEARAFVARYTARYGERPDVRAALAYEATLLLGHAALAVDLDAPDRRRRVRSWLASLGHTAPAVRGVAGPIAFDGRHGVIGRGVTIAVVPASRSTVR